MKILNKILAFFIAIIDFLLCLLRSNCEYSLKKFLAYFFTALIFYLAIYQQNVSGELLIFLAALLGMREVSKKFSNNHQEEERQDKPIGFNAKKNNENKG